MAVEGERRVRCEGCERTYPIRTGIPHFADAPDSDGTSRSFAYEFTVLDPEVAPRERQREDVVTFFRATGLDQEVYRRLRNSSKRIDLTPEDLGYEPDGSSLRGRSVLDAGCGGGRFSRVAASYGARVVAFDRSDAVERTAAVTQDVDVDVVQGDILRPPFKPGVFDLVFSIGVLHHTADTRAGLQALARLVSPGGTLAIWVYAPEYWGGSVRGSITRAIRSVLLRLPFRAQVAFCRSVLYPIGRLQMRLARRRWTKLAAAPLFLLNVPRYPDRDLMLTTIFDYWAAPVIRTHRAEELYDWLVEEGLEEIRILPMPTAVTARRPAR